MNNYYNGKQIKLYVSFNDSCIILILMNYCLTIINYHSEHTAKDCLIRHLLKGWIVISTLSKNIFNFRLSNKNTIPTIIKLLNRVNKSKKRFYNYFI
jgi:hypothetical protein